MLLESRSVPLPWENRTLCPPHCLQLLWQDVSPVPQVRTGGRAGNVLEAAPAPAGVSCCGTHLFQGERKPGEESDSCCDITRHFLVFPAATWLLSASLLDCTCTFPHLPWIPAQISLLVTVQASAGVVPAMFSRGAAGFVSSPPHRAGGSGVTCASTSPGPPRASASFQGPLNKGFLGKLEKHHSAKAQTCPTSLPLPAEQWF